MKRHQLWMAWVVLASAVAVQAAAGEQQKDTEQTAKLLAECRQALAKGDRQAAQSLADSAFKLDNGSREALLLHLFANEPVVHADDAKIANSLKQKVSFDFAETPLTDVVTFVQCITNATVILDPKALKDMKHAEVTLKVTDMPLSQALDWIAQLHGLSRVVHEGAIFITDAETAKAMNNEPAVHADDAKIANSLKQKVSFDFAETPLRDVVTFLQGITNATVILNPKALKGTAHADVTLKVTDMPLSQALDWIAHLSGLSCVIREGAIFITDGEAAKVMNNRPAVHADDAKIANSLKQKVSFDFAETPLTDVLVFLQTVTKATVILDPKAAKGIEHPLVTLKATEMPLSQVLDWIAQSFGLSRVVHEGAIFITDAETAKAMKNEAEPSAVPETAKAMKNEAGACAVRDCRVQLFGAAAAAKPGFTGYAFSCPASIFCVNDDRVVLKIVGDVPAPKGNDAPTSEARRKHYAEAELPKWLPAMKACLEKRVSFHVHRTSLHDLITFLKQAIQYEIALDQSMKGAQVSLTVADQPVHRALNWAAQACDVRFVVQKDRISIISKDQAASDPKIDQYEVSQAAAELRVTEGDVRTQLSGLAFRETRTGVFFIILSDAEGREMKLKGIVEEGPAVAPLPETHP